MNKYEETATRRWEALSAEMRKAQFILFYATFLRLHDTESPAYVGGRESGDKVLTC